MPIVLISATSSAYARMNQIALIEKGIKYEVQTDVPYNSTTKTPDFNPLEKLPILIVEEGLAIYDSSHIQEYILQKFVHQRPSLLPKGLDAGLEARQIQVLAQGVLDAITLLFFEKSREKPSPEWQARQNRKVDGGLRVFSDYAKSAAARNYAWLIDDTYSIADIAVGCALGWVDLWMLRPGWKDHHQELALYWARLADRYSFKLTAHTISEIVDKVV